VYSGLSFYLPGVVPAAVLAVALAAALLDAFRGEPERLTDRAFLVCTGLFLMAVLHSIVAAHYPVLSFKASTKLFKALAMIFLIVHYVQTRAQLRRLAVVVFAGALATVAFGIINLKLGIHTVDNVITTRVQIYRFSGAHANPNVAASILCSAIPMGVFAARNARRNWAKVLGYAGVLVLTVGIFLTFSRSAIFGFAVVAVALIARELRTRGGYLVVAALLALALLLTPQFYWDRLQDLQQVSSTNVGRDMSVMLRYTALQTAWALFLDHPWFGIGLENFIERGSVDVVNRIVVHNTYVEILVGTGIFGLVTYAGMLWAGLRHALGGAVRAWGRETRVMRSLSFYILLSGVSIAVSSLFGSMQFLYQLWIPVAAGLVLARLAADEGATAPPAGR
jgi:O-antigen ligase